MIWHASPREYDRQPELVKIPHRRNRDLNKEKSKSDLQPNGFPNDAQNPFKTISRPPPLPLSLLPSASLLSLEVLLIFLQMTQAYFA